MQNGRRTRRNMKTIKALLIGVPIMSLLIGVVYGCYLLVTNFDMAPHLIIGVIVLIMAFMLGNVALDLIEEHKKDKLQEKIRQQRIKLDE